MEEFVKQHEGLKKRDLLFISMSATVDIVISCWLRMQPLSLDRGRQLVVIMQTTASRKRFEPAGTF